MLFSLHNNSVNIKSFLHTRSYILDYYIALFISNLFYNLFNIFNIILIFPLLYVLYSISKPKNKNITISIYILALLVFINLIHIIGITVNIYIFGIKYLKTIHIALYILLIGYMCLLYLFSFIVTLFNCVVLKEFIYFKHLHTKISKHLIEESHNI